MLRPVSPCPSLIIPSPLILALQCRVFYKDQPHFLSTPGVLPPNSTSHCRGLKDDSYQLQHQQTCWMGHSTRCTFSSCHFHLPSMVFCPSQHSPHSVYGTSRQCEFQQRSSLCLEKKQEYAENILTTTLMLWISIQLISHEIKSRMEGLLCTAIGDASPCSLLLAH